MVKIDNITVTIPPAVVPEKVQSDTSQHMLALGQYRFSLQSAAYQSLSRQYQFRWASQAAMGVAPVMQFLGAGETKQTLQGEIYPFYRGGFGQLEAMAQEAGLGNRS